MALEVWKNYTVSTGPRLEYSKQKQNRRQSAYHLKKSLLSSSQVRSAFTTKFLRLVVRQELTVYIDAVFNRNTTEDESIINKRDYYQILEYVLCLSWNFSR